MIGETWNDLDGSTKTAVVAIVLVVVAAGSVAVLFVGSGGSNEAAAPGSQDGQEPVAQGTPDETGETERIRPGMESPDASFTAVNGSTYDLTQFRSKQVMLWFPGATCADCQQQVRYLAENKSRVANLTIIAVPPQSTADEVVAFADQFAPTTMNESNWIWGTPSQEMEDTYNSERIFGLSYLIDGNGTVVAKGSKPANNIMTLQAFAEHPSILREE